jgi:tellurite resistance protein TerC
MDVSIWLWVGVLVAILAALAVDLFVFHKDAHEVSIREAGITSAIWVTVGLAFGLVIWKLGGGQAAGEYYAGYVIEKALSVENIFVFALILGYFNVPPKYQHRVLFFGVLGALVFRAIFIAAGAQLLERFHAMVYVFGAFLILTAIKMVKHSEMKMDPGKNPMVRALRRLMPVTNEYHGQKFFIRRHELVEGEATGTRSKGKLIATPMLAVLLAIETSDVIFAVDSIPAIFAITDDTFIVFTSNAFAILGLRALYFLLSGAMARLSYLKLGLAAVLGFVGVKMILSGWFKMPILVSLGVIVSILTIATVASLRRKVEPTGPIGTTGPTDVGAIPMPMPSGSSDPESMTKATSGVEPGAEKKVVEPV